MKAIPVVSLVIICLVIFVGFYFKNRTEELSVFEEREVTISRHLSFQVQLRNVTGKVVRDIDLKVRLPNRGIGNQKCLNVNADFPHTLSVDKVNNQLIGLMFAELPPYGAKIITINATVDMFAESRLALDCETEKYIKWDEPFVQYKNVEIEKIAYILRGDSNTQTVRNIYNWVVANVAKESYNSRPKGAVYTLFKKRGDCTEFMHLFLALCRSNNIPARAVSGIYVREKAVVYKNDLHDWAQVYIDGKWRVVDAFFRNFLEKEDKYVALNVNFPEQSDNVFYRWSVNSKDLVVELLQ